MLRRRALLPRECDNDDCDYETHIGGDGVPRLVWEHVPGCSGLSLPELDTSNVPDGSFLAYLMARKGYI